jgi:type I restriction-modification system DNA methylase subunit
MALSWNEIKERAARFSKEWESACNEEAEAKPFLVEFFNVFGISQRKVSTFEHKVKKLDEHDGYIDLLWKGTILIEMKSKGKNLDKALSQARDYIQGLPQHELPKYILVSDFERYRLTDVDEEKTYEFLLKDFTKNVHLFGAIAGYHKRTYKEEDPVNIEAAELMGKLHDRLKAIGYTGHSLERYLVRLLFCLFADDTGIFEKDSFQDYIKIKTSEDGSDLAYHIAAIFNILNTPKDARLANIDEALAVFPYVNGKLFEESLPFASFDSAMRTILLECCLLDWSKISPAIFGSLFQSVMDEKARRNLGAHYTSEKNILKVIKPLFLDDLWNDFHSAHGNARELKKLQLKISNLRFLDPACGCGNFLIIAYRELRLLEIEIVKSLLGKQQITEIGTYFLVDVDKFYGIEYEEFPSLIAQVAMWLIDHQMNMQASQLFGDYFVRLPLKKSATIKHGDALEIEWQSLIEPMPWEKGNPVFDFIMGNPPFIGSKMMKQEQRDQIVNLFNKADGSGVLDYVTGWYIKAATYIQNTKTKVAFVSTNSIVQGEQTGILWGQMLNTYKIKIHFAHRTFKWSNEAKGNAAVYCVIVGFANFDTNTKFIYEYEDIKGEAHQINTKNINPYLVDAKDIYLVKRVTPICNVPKISKGNQPTDGGNLILNETEKNEIISKHPILSHYIKQLVGAEEFLHNTRRYCFWFPNSIPQELRHVKEITERLKRVQIMRLASTDPKTRELANEPYRFREMKNYKSFVIIPSTTSENRKYIPMGFGNETIMPTNLLLIIPNSTLYHFGILMSKLHMNWVKYVCGRLKSDYRYSKDIVYNNFPWPENPSEKQVQQVEKAAQKVLDVREEFPESSLADLYDPLTMPPALVKAHNELDKAVDLCYRPQPFASETKRIEYLFELYEKYTAGLFVEGKKKRK